MAVDSIAVGGQQGTMRLWHLQPFEARSLLAEVLVKQHPAASAAITEALLNRLEGSRPLSSAPKRCCYH